MSVLSIKPQYTRCKFTVPGDEWDGVIVSVRDTRQSKTYASGDPAMQAVITWDIADGPQKGETMQLFAASRIMISAIQAALEEANERDVATGGRLRVRYVGDTDGAKSYRAWYTPPVYGTIAGLRENLTWLWSKLTGK